MDFNIGDRVKIQGVQYLGTIIEVYNNGFDRCVILYGSGQYRSKLYARFQYLTMVTPFDYHDFLERIKERLG